MSFGDSMYQDPRDGPDITELSNISVVARKEHKCCGCPDTIKPGERYRRVTYIDHDRGSKLFSDAWHGVCPRDVEEERRLAEQDAKMFEGAA